MSELAELTRLILDFRDQRSWGKFHTLKDLSMALSIEAAELQELGLWKSEEELVGSISDEPGKSEFDSELADILMYLLLIADKAQIDLAEAVRKKLERNQKRFPVEDFNGTFDKQKRRDQGE